MKRLLVALLLLTSLDILSRDAAARLVGQRCIDAIATSDLTRPAPSRIFWKASEYYLVIVSSSEGSRALICRNDPINNVDPLGLWAWDSYYIEPFFNGTFWVESGKTTGRLTVRTVKGVGQAGLIGSDMLGYGSSSAFGWGGEYQGNSQLFQTLYANPTALGSASEVGENIAKGAVKELLNIGTLGGYGMAERFGEGLATGDFEAAQDRALQGLLISAAAKSMQASGVNPWTGKPSPAAAADRLGVDLSKVEVTESGVAEVRIGVARFLLNEDIQVLRAYLRARGATSVDVDSGWIVNARLLRVMTYLARKGGRFQGGRVTATWTRDGQPVRFNIAFEEL